MRYAVIGAGGIGGLVGGALAREGHPVTMILRGETARNYPRSLSVRSQVLGNFTARVSVGTELVDEVDAVWVTVKAPQLEDALASLPNERLGQGLVIPLMNGVDHLDRLRALYPPANVVAGSIRVESERVAPGQVRQLSLFAAIQLAAPTTDARVLHVAEEIRGTGLACDVVQDEASMLWGKLAFLAPLALTTTAKGANLGEIRSDLAWRRRLEGCLTEVCQAAQAAGAEVDRDQTLARLNAAPDTMRSSMQKDVEAGRTPELDAIGGPVVRLGRTHGLDVATTIELIALIEQRSNRG